MCSASSSSASEIFGVRLKECFNTRRQRMVGVQKEFGHVLSSEAVGEIRAPVLLGGSTEAREL